MSANRLWRVLFPLKVGDKVRYVLNTGRVQSIERQKMFNHVGKIIEELDDKYKGYLISIRFYSEEILQEKCFQVKFPEYKNTRFSFRQIELEKVMEDET